MNWTLEAFACVVVLRAVEALIACAPTLLAGLVTAAIVECLLPGEPLRRFFARAGTPRSIAVGLLLPVCSFGVVPVAVALRRKRVDARAVAIVALSAGIAHPLFVGYGLQNVGVGTFVALVGIGLIVCAATARLAARVAARVAAGRATDDEERVGRRGLAQLLPAAGALLVGRAGVYLLIGFVGCGASAICVPPGWFGDMLFDRSAWNVPLMAAASFAAYAPPEMAIMQTRGILEMGTAPGAAVCWAILAGGMNLAIVAFWLDAFRWRSTLVMVATLLALTIGAAYAFDYAAFDGHTAAEDTHALDDHGRPFHHGDYGDGPVMATWHKLGRQVSNAPARAASLAALGVALAVGAIGRARGDRARDASVVATSPAGLLGRPVGRRAFALAGAALGIGLALAALYAYYPSPSWTYASMRQVNAEMVALVRSGRAGESRAGLGELRAALTRVRIGAALRRGPPSAACRDANARFAASLDATDSALGRPDPAAALDAIVEQSKALGALGAAIR